MSSIAKLRLDEDLPKQGIRTTQPGSSTRPDGHLQNREAGYSNGGHGRTAPTGQPQSVTLDQASQSARRYARLELLERQSAETLGTFCRVTSEAGAAAKRLANVDALQNVLTSLPLAVADVMSLTASLGATYLVASYLGLPITTNFSFSILVALAFTVLPLAHLAGLYPGLGQSQIVEFRQVARTLSASVILCCGIAWVCLGPAAWMCILLAPLAFCLALPATIIARYATRVGLRRMQWWGVPTLIVAEPGHGRELYQRMRSKPEYGFRPVGIVVNPSDYWKDESFSRPAHPQDARSRDSELYHSELRQSGLQHSKLAESEEAPSFEQEFEAEELETAEFDAHDAELERDLEPSNSSSAGTHPAHDTGRAGTDGLEAVPIFQFDQMESVALQHNVTWAIVSHCAGRDVAPSLDPMLAAIPNRLLLSSSQLELGIWDQLFCIQHTCGIRMGGARPNVFQLFAKRLVDLTLTCTAVLLGLPFLIALCLAIKFNSRGPIFYGQKRIGRYGVEFKAWKFRSMQQNADQVLEKYLDAHPEARAEWEEKRKLKHDPRVTQIGRFLRATSLDELPQLWNVITGDMSLVGPRPIIDSPTYDAAYIEQYPHEYELYKSVRPGLTGLWQVECRNRGVYDLRIYWDMYYIRNWCLWLDLYLIMRTIKVVLFREGS